MIDLSQEHHSQHLEYANEQMPAMPNDEEMPAIALARQTLMRQCNLNSDEADNMLQNMAKTRNISVGDLATQLIETVKRLIV